MLHALRRSNLQHCIDLEETGSICCHYLRVFVTVSLFFFICGPVEEPHGKTTLHAEESVRQRLRRILVRTAALKKFCAESDQQMFFL